MSDDKTLQALSGGGGSEIVVGAKSKVQHAALAGAHGSEVKRLTGAADLFGGSFGSELQFLGPHGLKVIRVERYLVVLFVFEPNYFCGNVLKCAQQLSATLRKQSGVGAGKLHINLACFELIGIGCAGSRCDPVLKSETPGSGEGLKKGSNVLRGC
jgi:hypothetical protein